LDNKLKSPIPEPIAQLQRQLEEFRSTRRRRTKLPEALWQSAMALAREHGLYSVAHPLRLDYAQLKKRLGGTPSLRKKATKPAFIELISAHPATMSECLIEIESSIGGKMRIQLKGSTAPDWACLLRAWRESER
jgi:hypothetical protein